MKTLYKFCLTSFVSTGLVLPIAGHAEVGNWDLSFRPRIETGLMDYKLKNHDLGRGSREIDEDTGQTTITSGSATAYELTDTMPFVGLGFTVTAGRWFVDVSGKKAFDGEDSEQWISATTESSTDGSGNIVEFFNRHTQRNQDVDFDRDEYALSIGYGVTADTAIYAGWKWVKTDFSVKSQGPVTIHDSQLGKITATETWIYDFDFDYDGPFIGVTHGINISKGFLDGVLSFNAALAFLEGELVSETKELTIDGISFNPDEKFEGDTLGTTLGVTWNGTTGVEGLNYSLGIDGYKYSFESDDDDLRDREETAINYKIGLSYAF